MCGKHFAKSSWFEAPTKRHRNLNPNAVPEASLPESECIPNSVENNNDNNRVNEHDSYHMDTENITNGLYCKHSHQLLCKIDRSITQKAYQ